MSWSRPFDDPIPTPKGEPLVTLKDAAAYIMALPKKEADTAEWQACILVEEANRSCKAKPLFALGGVMDNSFLKEHAARCRSLAGNADEFTKRRLLDLAAKYDDRLLSQPSRASRVIKLPVNLPHAPSELL